MSVFLAAWVSFILGALFAFGCVRWSYLRWSYRMAAAERCILDLLAASPEPMYGLDLIDQSGGRLKRGTVYLHLNRLQSRGLVVSSLSTLDGWGCRRRLYKRADGTAQ